MYVHISLLYLSQVNFQKGNSEDVISTVSAIFFFVNIATVPLLSAMVPLVTERAVFYRETLSGTYSRFAYGIAVQIAELPFNLFFGLVSFLCFYFLIGLSMEGGRMIYFILMTLATYWVSVMVYNHTLEVFMLTFANLVCDPDSPLLY